MHPLIFGFDTYTLARMLAVVCGSALTWTRLRRMGISHHRLLLIQVLFAIAGVLGAKVHSLVEWGQLDTLSSGLANPNGYRYPGGLLAVVLAIPVAARIAGPTVTAWRLADIVAPSIAIAMAVARIGCFLHGCCFGQPTSLPVGVRFPMHSQAWLEHVQAGLIGPTASMSAPVHPLQLYFFAWSSLVAWWLLRGTRQRDGTVVLSFLVLHEGGKAMLELLRAPAPAAHLVLTSGILAVGAGLILALRGRREPARAYAGVFSTE